MHAYMYVHMYAFVCVRSEGGTGRSGLVSTYSFEAGSPLLESTAWVFSARLEVSKPRRSWLLPCSLASGITGVRGMPTVVTSLEAVVPERMEPINEAD